MLKIVTVGFDYGLSTAYKKMLDVLLYSIEKNCPDAEWISNWLPEPRQGDKIRGLVSNTVKLEKWVEELELAKDGDNLIFMDCDMLVLSELKDIFDNEFDVGYTVRESKYPINGGVIFAKKNERTINFFKRFLEINNRMFEDTIFHQFWRNRYAGINQAAFGYMLQVENNIANMVAFPCAIWNVCDRYEEALNNGAKVLHIKGQLRKTVFDIAHTTDPGIQRASGLWHEYYNEMINNERAEGTNDR